MEKIKKSTQYRFFGIKKNDKFYVQNASKITYEKVFKDGKVTNLRSSSTMLTFKQMKKLLKGTRFGLIKPEITYSVLLNKKLKVDSGYITKNTKLIRDLDKDDIANLNWEN